ncbi:TBC1 domain family member 30-like isoform X2 [Biomphalaria glabrata]|nr:TBC1 domain family member 30-like isoform X2 [Biomphalaria glabrata]
MKFSIQPPPGQTAFEQWRDAMKAVCRLPMGVPPEFRKKVWLSLADHYLHQLKINWENTVRFVFNERSNPDDEQLGMQIVKDLHRTGCSNFSGDDNGEDRAVLKRLLLAYARWNKRVGYCQGFNVIAALLLNVMDRKEDDALKVMIYLIDSVLPESYFANNLRALSVDMAVFRDLLKLTYPKLSKHLDKLQTQAQDIRTGACYEPPLTNVFTMQWFLTLFATCLPVHIVLRVWDSILLEGSEILLRTALTIWGKLAKRIMSASSADEFYCLMGELSSSMMQGYIFDGDTMVKSIYGLGEFPFPHLNELREKYTYNIRPLGQASAASGKKNETRSAIKSLINSDEDDMDDDDITAMACMPGGVNSSSDISVLGPGVYGPGGDDGIPKGSLQMERMTTDIQSLKLQYEKLKQRQRQAHIIIAAASAKKAKPASAYRIGRLDSALVPNIEMPSAMNHLFVGKGLVGASRNRLVRDGPRISAPEPVRKNSGVLAQQVQAVANAQAASKSQRMRTGLSTKSGLAIPHASAPSKTSSEPHSDLTEASPTKQCEPPLLNDIVSMPLNETLPETKTSPDQNIKQPGNSDDVNSLTFTTDDISLTKALPATPALDNNDISSSKQRESKLEHKERTLALQDRNSQCIEEDSREPTLDCLDPKEKNNNVDLYSEEKNVYKEVTLLLEEVTEAEVSNSQQGCCVKLDPSGEVTEHCEAIIQEKVIYSHNADNIDNSNPPPNEDGNTTSYEIQNKESENANQDLTNSSLQGDTVSSIDEGAESLVTSPIIETVPVPKLVALTVGSDSGDAAHHHRLKNNNSSHPEVGKVTHGSKVIPQSSLALSHHHNRSRRFSSPARTETVPSGMGHSSLIRKNSTPFNPFPVKQLNANRVKTGLKLGLYKPSTLEQFGVRKSGTTS